MNNQSEIDNKVGIQDSHHLESLQVWQKAMDFAVQVCKTILPTFPKDETYSLTSQLRRSVQSISANLAEGHGRYYYQDAIRFCIIARGSIEETLNHLIFAKKMNYLSEPTFFSPKSELLNVQKMLNGYIAYLRRTKKGEKELEHIIHDLETTYCKEDDEHEFECPDNPFN